MAQTKLIVIEENEGNEMKFKDLQIGDWFIFQEFGTLCMKVADNLCMDFDENDCCTPTSKENVTLIKEIEIKYKV